MKNKTDINSCRYTLDGVTYTYAELIDYIQKNKYAEGIDDVVFSKQEDVYNKTAQLKREYKLKKSQSFSDEEPTVEGALTPQQLINSPMFREHNSDSLITPYMDKQNYILNKAKQIVDEQGVSEEQAQKLAEKEANSWDVISQDALNLHNLVGHFDFRKSSYDFIKATKGTKYERTAADFYASLQDTLKRIYGKNEYKTVKNIVVEGELRDTLEKIVGHIDYLLIDKFGDLHIYNFKFSTQDNSKWPESKRENFRFQLAILKQLLAYNGYDVRKIDLNIIPVRMIYNDDYSKIDKLFVQADRVINDQIKNSKYAFTRYDRVARDLIPSKMKDLEISSDIFDTANVTLQAFFPENNVSSQGVQKTIQQQIYNAYKSGDIKQSTQKDVYYEVLINNKVFSIKSPEPPLKNKEIIALFTRESEMLKDGGIVVASKLVKDIINSYKLGFPDFEKSKGFAYSSQYLNTALKKYFENYKDENGTRHYEWEFKDNDILLSANILMFVNNKTGQTDFISLSPYDLDQTVTFSKNRGSSLGGYYLYNYEANGLPPATFGNVEAMRVMALINEVIPSLDNIKLGTLKVISPVNNRGKGGSIIYNFRQANTIFDKMISVAENNNQGMTIKNNFRKAQFLDPLEVLTQEYLNIINNSNMPDSEKQSYVDMGFKELMEEGTNEAKTQQLMTLMEAILNQSPLLQKATPQEIVQLSKSGGPRTRTLAQLYILTNQAYAYYSGDEVTMEKPISSFRANFSTANRDPRQNVRLVTGIVNQAIDRIHYDTVEKFTPIRKYIDEFYKSRDYSSLKNSTIGNQESQFRNLYERDDSDNLLLVFKNPYRGDNKYLNKDERKFLKKALFTFAKIRCEMKNIPFNFKDENDKDLQEFIETHDWYFDVPLEKASAATRRQHSSEWIKDKKQKMANFFKNPKQLFNEYLQNVVTDEEKAQREEDLSLFRLSNKFAFTEASRASRANYILKNGTQFFETNVENLLVDFLVAQETYKEMNKALIRAKSITLSLYLLGEETQSHYEQFIKDINDYLKLNVFNQSIMEKESQDLVGRTAPLKHIASQILTAADFTKFTRDVMQGVEQNFIRSVTKYMTDISSKSVSAAYKEVLQNICTNVASVNKISLLNKQFNISYDASNLSESLKTGRGGICNYSEYAYATLKRPDFLNRMVLFVARCIEDGCYDALYVENGSLKYDWRKDRRFSAYAKGDKNDKNYYTQRGLYLSMIRQYNKEHPDSQLSYADDLPTPYSNQEVSAIKNTANTIYGAYDKHIKAKYENMAIGWLLGQFTTWMNAWYNNYFMKPGAYGDGVLTMVQDTNEKGELLYFDDDGNITTIPTQSPVYKYVPLIVQGVWYTIKDSIKAIQLGEFRSKILTNPMQVRNLKKLFSDLFMWLLLGTLYKFAFDPLYKDFKKTMKDRNIACNSIVEAVFKGGKSTIDDYKGPYSIIDWSSETKGIPFISVTMSALQGLGQIVFGDKTLLAVTKGYIPFVKSFRDSFGALDKQLQEE